MAKDFESLKQQALLIKNEVDDGANTAERIGGILEDILDFDNEKLTELEISGFHINTQEYKKSGVLQSDGTVKAFSEWETLYKIPIREGDSVTVHSVMSPISETGRSIVIYDSNGSVIYDAKGTYINYTFTQDGFVSLCYNSVMDKKINIRTVKPLENTIEDIKSVSEESKNILYPYRMRLMLNEDYGTIFPIEINTTEETVTLKGFRILSGQQLTSIIRVSNINVNTPFYNGAKYSEITIFALYLAYKANDDVFATMVQYSDRTTFMNEYSSYQIYEIGRGFLRDKGKFFSANCNFIFDGNEYYISTPVNSALEFKNRGKSIGVFGGSLSVYSESETAKTIWKNLLGVEVTNYGVPGAGFSSLQGTSIQQQVDGAGVHDIYVLWASTNDYTTSRECGEWSDYTAVDRYDESKLTTQCGGINYAIKKLLEKNPKAEIYFFTSLRFFTQEAGYNPFSNQTNGTGKTFSEYVDAQKKCCQHYSIPILDQYSIQGVNEFNYTLFYREDKLHMNSDGYAKIGYQQAYFLMNGK